MDGTFTRMLGCERGGWVAWSAVALVGSVALGRWGGRMEGTENTAAAAPPWAVRRKDG